MFNIFNLPLEVINLVLSNLDYQDLTNLFELDSLPKEVDGDYLQIKHMALLQCYQGKRVVYSNDATRYIPLTNSRLDYLISTDILIKPKRFKLVLNRNIKMEWLNYMRNFEDIHMVVTNIKNFNQFCGLYTDIMFNLNDTNFLNRKSIQSLSIHFFDIDKLLKTTNRFESLTFLDLSYNRLESLQQFHLPITLKSLNLSNNTIWRIDGQLNNLIELTSLDLSNNNLLDISINLPQLTSLNLSGNNLMNNRFGQSLPKLEILDLSRNLITNLTKFPHTLKAINLSNNHLCNHIDYSVFPPYILHLNLSWCRLSEEAKTKLPFVNVIS